MSRVVVKKKSGTKSGEDLLGPVPRAMQDRLEEIGGHELLRCAHDVLRQLARSEDVRQEAEVVYACHRV